MTRICFHILLALGLWWGCSTQPPPDPIVGIWVAKEDTDSFPFALVAFRVDGRCGWSDITDTAGVFEMEADWYWTASRDSLWIHFDTLPMPNPYNKITEEPNEVRFYDFTNLSKLVLER